MIEEFKAYLYSLGKSDNTVKTYCRDAGLYLSWCRDSFGETPRLLYRTNVLEYISYMRNVRNYNPKTVNNHLSSLRSLNEYLIQAGCIFLNCRNSPDFSDRRSIIKEKGGVKSQLGSPHLFVKLRGHQNITAKLGKRLYLFAKEEKGLVAVCYRSLFYRTVIPTYFFRLFLYSLGSNPVTF